MPVDPASLTIRIHPDPVLRKKAQPITEITEEHRAVAEAMFALMRTEHGIGLAAPQVGLSWRMFVVDIPEDEGQSVNADPPTATNGRVVYINPVLREPEGAVVPFEEGCLSLPEIRGDVLRPPVITIHALGLDGKPFTQRGGGLLARCWQHEMDHLDGVLIIDKMTQMSRIKNRIKLRDLERGDR